jgi:hypothetical protein
MDCVRKLKFDLLNIIDKQILESAFRYWYKKNGEQSISNVSFLVQDMFEACDTEIFALKKDNEIFGVFFYIISGNKADLGGGLIEGKKSSSKLAHYVFNFSVEYLNQKGIKTLCVSVINKHYKYNSIVRYYKSYGFELDKVTENQTLLSLIIN